jgi:DNA-binding transcriptional regulator LsrR (DeoR family)
MVRALRPTPKEDLSLVQAMGSIGHEALDIDFAELARDAAYAFGARVFIIPAPAIVGTGTAQALIRGTPSIEKALQLARSSDIYVVGLGSLESDLIYARAGLVSDPQYQHLKTIDAVGDICGRFFDLRGRLLRSSFEDRIVGIELGDLRQASLAVGVAGGPEKVGPLLGALRGGYISAVVTDEKTALGILELEDRSRRS